MALFVLDTDHVTLLQHGHSYVVARLHEAKDSQIAVSIVTYEEQVRGRLAVVQQAKTPERLSLAYLRLRETHEFFCSVTILDFDSQATATYSGLRATHRTLGTLDLRIAATTLVAGAKLVTRNKADFSRISGLELEDWSSAPPS